jgi:HK97 family phage major capsid protein
VRIPGILGKMAQRKSIGKALPLTSGTATANSLVWADYISELEKFDPEETVLWDRVRKIPTTHGEVILPAVDQDTNSDNYAGASFGWTAEGAAAPGQEPKFKQLDFPMYEAKAKTELANRLLRRSTINIEAFVTWLFSSVLANGAEQAVINGTGVGQPTGIFKAGNFISIARTAGNNAVNYDDCVKVKYGVTPNLRKNGIWVVADALMALLMEIKDLQGRPIFLQSLRDGEPDTLLGRPIYATTRKTLGTAGDLSYGDPKRYIAPVEQETVIAKSEHQKFDQGVTVFLAFMAMGGNVSTNRGFAGLAANS